MRIGGLRLNAIREFGFDRDDRVALPRPRTQELVVRCGAWKFLDVWERLSPGFIRRVSGSKFDYESLQERLKPGCYRVRFPLDMSNRMTSREQRNYPISPQQWMPATMVIMLLELLKDRCTLANGFAIRCPETTLRGDRVVIFKKDGQLFYDDQDGSGKPDPYIWIASCEWVGP